MYTLATGDRRWQGPQGWLSSSARDRRGGPRGEGGEEEVGGVSGALLGTTSRPISGGDALLMLLASPCPRPSSASSSGPESVDRTVTHEERNDGMVSGGESTKASRDPDLRYTDPDPPLFSSAAAPSNSNTTTRVCLVDELTRLVSFLDLAKLPLGHEYQSRDHGAEPQNGPRSHHGTARSSPEDHYETDSQADTKSVASSTTINSTAYTVSIPTTPAAITTTTTITYAQTFFDPTPSTGRASPSTPPYDTARSRSNETTLIMVPELSLEPAESRLSSSFSIYPDADAMHKNIALRPRSAPKTSSSSSNNMHPKTKHSKNQRSASPFQFWTRKEKDNRPQSRPDDYGRNERHMDSDYIPSVTCTAAGRDSDDAAYVDSVCNHLGRLTPQTRPGSGTPNARRDWADQAAHEVECQGPQPPITREEYMALPEAIQRKYFSALERLQFAQDSVHRIYNHYDLTSQNQSPNKRKHRPAHSSPSALTIVPNHRDLRNSYLTTESDSSWVVGFQEKVNKADLTREEQVNLIKHLRASVIIEAANEAFIAGRHSTDRKSPSVPDIDHSTATLSSRRGSLDSMTNSMASAMGHQLELNGKDPMRQSLYDSFRWLDEEEDLDLGLDCDEYHANLREDVPQTSKKRRPSFRRRISISKTPFGRSSMTADRPGSKDSPSSPTLERFSPNNIPTTQRRLSRTLSIMNPTKHFQTEPAPTIDPTAAHYQDPEARQKLRAYLASPTKFDEAVQYGFPATRDSTPRPSTSDMIKGHTRPSQSTGSDNMRSFLDFDGDEEEEGSIRDDDASSVSDSDSPKTPQLGGGLTPPPGHRRPMRSPTDPLNLSSSTPKAILPKKPMSSDSTTRDPACSREMTLRMTLTRSDLRANEELIYGWQPQAPYVNVHTKRKSQTLPTRSQSTVPSGRPSAIYWGEDGPHQVEDENALAGVDHWTPDAAEGDKNVMKRFWNKVRRA